MQRSVKAGLTLAAAPALATSLASCGAPPVETETSSGTENPLSKTIADNFNRLDLAHLPTPLEKLKALTSLLNGPQVYVKRDDQTRLAFGGNKTRKLEFIIADAVNKNSDVIITTAGLQSNWCRQTAAAARIGLRSVAEPSLLAANADLFLYRVAPRRR